MNIERNISAWQEQQQKDTKGKKIKKPDTKDSEGSDWKYGLLLQYESQSLVGY